MLSGLKFIPRDQIDKAQDEDDDSGRDTKKSGNRKEKEKRKKKNSRYDSSEDDLERIAKGTRKKKKWYSSEECSSHPTGSESESNSNRDEKKGRNRKREKKIYGDSLEDGDRDRSKKKLRSRRKDYSPEDYSLSNSKDEEDEDVYFNREDKRRKGSKNHGQKKGDKIGVEMESTGDDFTDNNNIVRKEMGLEWMLRPKDNMERKPATTSEKLEEPQVEEIKKENPRELNPYFKNKGTGYPEDADGTKAGGNQLLSSAVVGDGGASWRLKALKRAQEQSARDGRTLEDVVEERWGSLGNLAVSVASRTAAPSHSHLHAIKNRKRGQTEEQKTVADDQNEKVTKKNVGRGNLQDVSRRHLDMKVPKLHDSLSWGKRKSQIMSSKDSGLISTALSSLNKFVNDGSFMHEASRQQNDDPSGSLGSPYKHERKLESELDSLESTKPSESRAVIDQGLSANQLAAKALQLRLKGKHEEAEKLLHESATRAVDNNVWDEIRNFKKCLIMMFANQEKDLVFLETVMGLAQQRRHCLIECIPLPRDIAKQAPLYFKKAIDEAEDEWSQHNSKKLIDTSEKGLHGSIPKDFPYFHVEFGLNKGFVHVIDDEEQFKSNFALNVVRGMLRLPEEDMYGRRKHDSVETQKQAVASFVRDWEPFDWTKQLG